MEKVSVVMWEDLVERFVKLSEKYSELMDLHNHVLAELTVKPPAAFVPLDRWADVFFPDLNHDRFK